MPRRGHDLLRGRRRRAHLPAPGARLLRRGRGRPRAAGDLSRGGPDRRRGAAADVPHPVLGRSPHLLRAARPPAAAHAARAVPRRPTGARRLAAAHARRRRQPRSARPRRGPAVGLPDDGGQQHGQCSVDDSPTDQPTRPGTVDPLRPGRLGADHRRPRRRADPAGEQEKPWWRHAVIYQIYIRSFADADGDGIGDLGGIRSRLPYLRDLGVDAIWITPFYPSPMADGGYDVADYRDVEPLFGTLGEAEALIRDAHALGLKVIIDIVPNHSSDQHEWFQAALAAGPGSPERERYIFRPGRGPDGTEPPNDWESIFGGSAWKRLPDGDWYLHLFAPEQPDLNWENPEVVEDFHRTLRFWLDRGVDGFRIDVANSLKKDQTLPRPGRLDAAAARRPLGPATTRSGTATRCTRSTAAGARSWTSTTATRAFVAEAWVQDPERLALVRAARRAAHRVQLRVPARALGRRRAAPDDRRVPGHDARGRRPDDLGAVQPRRDPARHALRPSRLHRRRRRPTRTGCGPTPRSTSPSACAGPGRQRCSRWPCPGRRTSTRARSSG